MILNQLPSPLEIQCLSDIFILHLFSGIQIPSSQHSLDLGFFSVKYQYYCQICTRPYTFLACLFKDKYYPYLSMLLFLVIQMTCRLINMAV